MNTRQIITKTTLLLLLTALLWPMKSLAQDPMAIMEEMISEIDNIRTLAYSQKKWERVEGELFYENSVFKMNRKPFKVYMFQYAPRENLEVIYKAGWNGGKAKVNAGKLIPNLSLDINGSRMRENQHHNITAVGFDQLAQIVRKLKSKYGDKARELIAYKGKVKWDGKTCHKIQMENPNFGWKTYTVKAGEDLLTIAKKYALSEHMILEGNSNVDDYDDVRAGQKIRIPSDYAKKTTFLIDTETMLPIKTVVYDDKGLYARYEFFNLWVNPPFSSEVFDPENDDYGF